MAASLLATVRAHSMRLDPECVRQALLSRLTPARKDRILELGVGSGSTLLAVAMRAHEGFVAGVEPDPLALRHAKRRCERVVRGGRVSLVAGSSADLSMFEAASFDKAYGVQVSSFWDEPAGHLAEIRRVLRPCGLLLLGQSAWLPDGLASGERLENALRETRFLSVHTDCADPMVWTTARRQGERNDRTLRHRARRAVRRAHDDRPQPRGPRPDDVDRAPDRALRRDARRETHELA